MYMVVLVDWIVLLLLALFNMEYILPAAIVLLRPKLGPTFTKKDYKEVHS